jgi:mannose-6-phosphate isomerase
MKPGSSLDAMRQAIADHTLESMVEQVPVQQGDMIFVDAGTVHAIGPGVVLLETQQTSDITYRLYDYGRPRELHIDRGLAATRLHTAAGKVPPRVEGNRIRLIEKQYFIVDRLGLRPDAPYSSSEAADAPAGVPHALVAVEGTAVLLARDCEPLDLIPGRAVVVPASVGSYTLESSAAASVLRSSQPAT